MLQDLNKSPTVCVCVCVLRHDYVQRVMTCCRVTQYVRLCQRMYKNTNSPNWMAHRGWSQCTSRFWVPLPARPPESSPRACPRWRSWWILPHSHFCPWLVGAPPERLHVTKLVPVTTAVFCFVFFTMSVHVQDHMYVERKIQPCRLGQNGFDYEDFS